MNIGNKQSLIANNIITQFDFRNARIKTLVLHCTHTWLAYITHNNVFSLWNYQHKIILKSFNCSTLDDTKQLDIKQLLFFDKYMVKSVANSKKQGKTKNVIIFCGQRKIFFYDYITDGLKVIAQKQLDFKIIRKIQIIGEDTLCIGTNQGSLKIIDINHLTVINTLKGYHTKPINWIIPYLQNQNQKPTVIAASIDSLMACWKVDSTSQIPSFKFLMKKNKSTDSNDGQQILHMRYDQANFRILTLTQEYITFWSTLSGSQIKRFRNNQNLRQIQIFNHINFGPDSFISHKQGQQIFLSTIAFDGKNTNAINPLEINILINLKEYLGQNVKIIKIVRIYELPNLLVMVTTIGISIVQICKFYRQMFCFKESFVTKLSISNHRQFFSNDLTLLNNVTPYKINNIQFKSQELYNIFYLTAQKNWVYYNLVQIKEAKMTCSKLQLKFFQIDNNLLKDKIQIDVSFQAKHLSLFSKSGAYYQIYYVVKPKSSLIQLDDEIQIDFHSKFKQIQSGLCVNLVWHQYKTEFAIIAPINANNNIVKLKSTSSKNIQTQSKIVGHNLFIYTQKADGYFQVIYRKDINSQIYKLFGGPYYVYSLKAQLNQEQLKLQLKKSQKIQFLQTQNGKMKMIVSPSIYYPQKIYWSYCGTICIMFYRNQFTVYKVESKGMLVYVKNIQQAAISGYFWQKLFFFCSQSSIYFLHVVQSQVILIKLADRKNTANIMTSDNQIFQNQYIDTLQEQIQQMPAGQIQLLSIINGNLLAINQQGELIWFKLKNRYLNFCIEVISGRIDQIKLIYSKVEVKLRSIFDDTLRQYGYEGLNL